MNTVQPIRDREKIKDIAEYLGDKNERDRIMFGIGIYVGLRVSDILEFRIRDIRSKDGKIKDHVAIREIKTGKEKYFPINSNFKNDLAEYVEGKADREWLFPSRQGDGRKHITRQRAYGIIREAGEQFGLENLGTHTMRKTFGYWHYQTHRDIATLQKIFNHSSPAVTMHYIGIDQEYMDKTMSDLDFGI